MAVVVLLPAFGLVACGPADEQNLRTASSAVVRKEGDTVVVDASVPDCDVLDVCPVKGVEKEQCIDDPALVSVELLDGMVVNVALLPEKAVELDAAVPAGTFFTVFPDPLGGCAVTTVSFAPVDLMVVEDEVPVNDEAADAGGAP